MAELVPGAWSDDDGTLHVDLDEMIRANGYEPNEQNRRVLGDAWRDMARQLGIEYVEVVSPPTQGGDE